MVMMSRLFTTSSNLKHQQTAGQSDIQYFALAAAAALHQAHEGKLTCACTGPGAVR